MRAGGVILGVSLDDKESHQKFIKKFGLPFPLLSDEDAAVSKAYGVYKRKICTERNTGGSSAAPLSLIKWQTQGRVQESKSRRACG